MTLSVCTVRCGLCLKKPNLSISPGLYPVVTVPVTDFLSWSPTQRVGGRTQPAYPRLFEWGTMKENP